MIFNVRAIIEDNYKLLYKDSSKSHVYFWLFGVPVVISLAFILFGVKFNDNQYTYLISFIAIIVGFLINATVVLISTQNGKGQIYDFLKKRSQANIFYTVIIGILIIILVIIKPCFGNAIFEPLLIPYFVIPVVNVGIGIFTLYYFFFYSLFAHFFIMILIILKVFYSLFN
jgi:hypothetical protein